MKKIDHRQLSTLFFITRQIIRQRIPGKADPYAWLRYETLRYIARAKEPSMRDIAQYLRIKAPSATSLMRNLRQRGLIERRKSAEDRRRVRIVLSSKGRVYLRQHEAAAEATLSEVFEGAGTRDIRELIRILGNVRDIHARRSQKDAKARIV